MNKKMSIWKLDVTTEVLNKFAKRGAKTVGELLNMLSQVELTHNEWQELECGLERWREEDHDG